MDNPKLSVIIPLFARAGAITHLIDEVLPALETQGFYSVNTEPLRIQLERYEQENFLILYHRDIQTELIIVTDKCVHPETRNCCLQINIGLKKAKGEVFCLLQQDVVADADTIATMTETVLANPNLMLWANVYKQRYPGDLDPMYWVGERRQNEAWFLITANREKLVEMGGVEERFARYWGVEDVEFLDRAKKIFDVQYSDMVRGVHLWHPEHPIETKGGDNFAIYAELLENPNRVGNEGREWGIQYTGERDDY